MQGFDLIITPDAEEPEAAEVFVDGSIGGRSYRFVLDTGAARTSVQHDGYTSTFAVVAQRPSSGVFTTDSDALVVLPCIVLGPIRKTDRPACAWTAADRSRRDELANG